MLSQRNLTRHVAHSCLYEFEDIICDIDAVDLFAPSNSYDFSRFVFTWLKRFTRSSKFANAIKPDPNPLVLDRDYDLLYVLLAHPMEILALNSIKNWRDRCKVAVCHVVEIWQRDIEAWAPILKLFEDFDRIYLGHYYVQEGVAQITGRPCSYIPNQINAIKFCPYPTNPDRTIDCSYIGRNSDITHAALLNLSETIDFFYNYDTFSNLYTKNYKSHRSLLANQLKRTRYFIANQARANCPELRQNQSEIGYRFFEGAAAGTVMLGDHPKTDIFNHYFSWPDAVIPIPFDAPDLPDLIADLDRQPERLARIRHQNVTNALLRFDGLHAWTKVLQDANLAPLGAAAERKKELDTLVELASQGLISYR